MAKRSGVEYLAQHSGWKSKPKKRARRVPESAGPLERLTVSDYCTACGATRRDPVSVPLVAAFNARGKATTLCTPCRQGCAELLEQDRQNVRAAARGVLAAWESGDLAAAVTQLGRVICYRPRPSRSKVNGSHSADLVAQPHVLA